MTVPPPRAASWSGRGARRRTRAPGEQPQRLGADHHEREDGATHVTPAQEALWYGLYGALLGVVAVTAWSRRPAAAGPTPADAAQAR